MLPIQYMLKGFLSMLPKEKLLVIFIFLLQITYQFSLDIFRPYPGFKSVRLIPREKNSGEKVIFCFADFENAF